MNSDPIKYILFSGGLQPKNPMKATDSKIKELSNAGYKHGKDYDLVPLKIITGNKNAKGGKIKTYSKGGGVRKPKMTAGY